MTVAEAARVWEENKRLIDSARPQLEAAAAVLKEYFEHTKRQDYKGIIGYGKQSYRAFDQRRFKIEEPELAEEYTELKHRVTLSLLR